MRWLIFSLWIVISIVAVKRDFEKIIFCETRNKCLIRREPWFSLCLCYFRQPLLRNKWYCVTVTGRLIPVATTWLVLVFGDHQPSFSSSVSSISTIMEEAHQRDVRDDQDHQQGQQVCMVLPNVTVLMSFFFKAKRSFFSVKREMPILFFVNCERTVLFSVKCDLDPPFTTLFILHTFDCILINCLLHT